MISVSESSIFILFIIGVIIGYIIGYIIGKWKQRFDDDTNKYFKKLMLNKKTR